MENASKALIIAGAILLSILLISLGIMIFNQAQSTINGSGMSDAQLTAFNQKWTKYEGNQKGSTIRSMVQEVMAYNNGEEASDETFVSVNYDNGVASTAGSFYHTVNLAPGKNKSPHYGLDMINTKTYKVEFLYDKGRVRIIKVTY